MNLLTSLVYLPYKENISWQFIDLRRMLRHWRRATPVKFLLYQKICHLAKLSTAWNRYSSFHMFKRNKLGCFKLPNFRVVEIANRNKYVCSEKKF
jgi:hypothetical protein